MGWETAWRNVELNSKFGANWILGKIPDSISNVGELLKVKVCRTGGKIKLQNPKVCSSVGRFAICKKTLILLKSVYQRTYLRTSEIFFFSAFEAQNEKDFPFLFFLSFFIYLIKHFVGSRIPKRITKLFLREKKKTQQLQKKPKQSLGLWAEPLWRQWNHLFYIIQFGWGFFSE